MQDPCNIALFSFFSDAYRNMFDCNIALFFLLLVMPIEIFLIWHQYPWPFGNIGCGFITLASELVTHVSIITMIAFTIER